MLWHDDEMRVWHAKTMNDQPNPRWLQFIHQVSRESLRGYGDAAREFVRKVTEVINVHFRNYNKLAFVYGSRVHERHNPLVLEQDARFGLVRHYAAEDA
jgi:hypothetical protein